MGKLKLFYLVLMALLLTPLSARAQQAYAALSDDGLTVTFYYDTKKAERNGVTIQGSKYPSATQAIFDASMDAYRPTSTLRWFSSCDSLERIVGMEYLHTENVTTMLDMFKSCSSLTSLDLSHFNTAKVTTMQRMFNGCSALTSLDLSSFNTQSVTSMVDMFYGCSSLTSLDMSSFNTQSETDLLRMFYGCSALTTIYAGDGWTTENATGANMFQDCYSLVGGKGTTFSASHTDAEYARIDGGEEAPGYFTAKADDEGEKEAYAVLTDDGLTVTFYYDTKKTERNGVTIQASNYTSATHAIFDTSMAQYRPTSTERWFQSCSSLETIVGMEYLNTTDVTNMYLMFNGCKSLTGLDLSHFNTASVTNMSYMFNFCSSLTSLDVSSFRTGNVTNMNSMFSRCSALKSLDLRSFNTENVATMECMFLSCSALTSLDVSSFSTVNVTEMSSMFSGCSALKSLDLSNFNTEKVTDINYMFEDCRQLESIDLSNFNTNNVASLYSVFNHCSALKSLDLSSFNTVNVVNMETVFSGCYSLKTIYVGEEWSTVSVMLSSSMFGSCSSLVGGKGTTYDSSHTDAEYARIDGGEDAPGYFTAKADDGEKEAYAVLNDEWQTVTFYYDAKKTERNGVEIDCNNYPSVSIAIFDASMADYRPVSTAMWFWHCEELVSIEGIEFLNTEDVTDMNNMFNYCRNLEDIDLSHFNTECVTNMNSMFYRCQSLTSLNLSNFNTENVIDMTNMFCYCDALTSLDLSNFNTENVMNMSGMFSDCQSITTLNVSDFNTEKVTNMSGMFYYCCALTSLDVSNFNTESVKDMSNMFNGCFSLTSLDVSNFHTGSVTSMSEMFRTCQSLTCLDLSNFKTENVTDMQYMFGNCSALTKLDVTHFNTENVTNMNGMFSSCSAMTTIDLSNFNTASVSDLGNMFNGCSALISLDVSHFNTDNVTNLGGMFADCSSLTSLDLSHFNTENVINMSYMFSYCSSLPSLDVSNFNTENTGNMRYMFSSCPAMTTIDLSNFNTEKVTNMQGMFYRSSSLTSLDLSNFNTGNVTNLSNMFIFCSALTTIYVGNEWTTENVTSSNEMFYGCTSLVGGMGTTYDANHTDAEYARIDGGEEAPGYFTSIAPDLEPISEDDSVDYGNSDDISEETDLSGTLVDNMYYSIGTDAGGYDSQEGCIVITQGTSDEQMELIEDLGITDEELNENFTGIIFKVPAGSGIVTVDAVTTGNMTLKVKVGNGSPIEMELSGGLKMKVPYNVNEETMVYIFAGAPSASRGMRRAEGEQSLKIYGIELETTLIKGDANADKKVNAADIIEVANAIVGKPSENYKSAAADMDSNGNVSITDLTRIIKAVKSKH